MRTAICFFGIVGGRDGKDGSGGNIPFNECHETHKRHIVDPNNADVFMHSWSHEVQDDLVGLYRPKRYRFEEQDTFDEELRLPPGPMSKVPKHKKEAHRFRSLSRWRSTQRVLELKTEYERENGFKYDCVMLLRFDVLFFADLDFSQYDMKRFYASHWNSPKRPEGEPDRINRSERTNGFLDLWFFSGSGIMDVLAGAFDGVRDGRYDGWQHRTAWACLADNGYKRKNFRFTLYRHFDFEVYRWYVLHSQMMESQ